MVRRFSREEVLERLRKTISEGRPIIGAGCSAGIIAKCAELAGADLIIVYSTGLSRLMGLPTVIFGDSNALTVKMAKPILNIVKNTPVIAGVDLADPTRDMERFLKKLMNMGFSGIINFPTFALYDRNEYYRRSRDDVGIGFNREVENFKLAHEMGFFTMAYVRLLEDTVEMVNAGADVIVAHAGRTMGGLAGGKRGFGNIRTLEQAAEHVQKIIEKAKSIKPDIIALAHGGPIATPDDTQYIYDHTDAVGFVGASSIERIPVERAVIETVKQFKEKRIKSS
ncbi:MAG: phosphoenolpyruvate hydrolase family protein [Thermoprotei archaeon]|nr:MAG: phosphoenolpyruvate hydrolase family protein [Thermoprotei archaeon]